MSSQNVVGGGNRRPIECDPAFCVNVATLQGFAFECYGRHVSCTNYALCDICWCIFVNVNKTKSKIFWIVDWFVDKEHVEISSRVFPEKQLQH